MKKEKSAICDNMDDQGQCAKGDSAEKDKYCVISHVQGI